ncbi:hypothetical protein [Undibacterium jejuense]|uniref:hypothetical protein n=1 Tax=Undibacterium jejuense TaxID=1344949 RepID=UPI001C9B2EAF|nr:hypothetical protein [Undibacterium jejuense]
MLFASSFTILTSVCSHVLAEEQLIIGRVTSITLLPSGSQSCPELNGNMKANADGTRTITLSNDCGCEETRIQVEETLLGTQTASNIKLQNRIGEWCKPNFPLLSEDLLIHIDGNMTRWSIMTNKDKKHLFNVKKFTQIGGVAVKDLTLNADQQASTEELIEKINSKK